PALRGGSGRVMSSKSLSCGRPTGRRCRRISRLTVTAMVQSFLSTCSCSPDSGAVPHPDHCSILLVARFTFLCQAFSLSSLLNSSALYWGIQGVSTRQHGRGGTVLHITRVEPFHVNWGTNKSAWVRIWTDNGFYGLGEASPMAYGNASLEIIASAFTPMLIGADPLAHRVLQDRLFHQHIKIGPEGAYAGALAAVDIALWDLTS